MVPDGGYVLRQEPVTQEEAVGGVETAHSFDQTCTSREEEPIPPPGRECDLQRKWPFDLQGVDATEWVVSS